MKYWILDRVPVWFRDKWPLKRFYWQDDEIARIEKRTRELVETLNWGKDE